MGFRSAVFTFGVLVALAVSGCQPETETAESISLDFPNGETRLLVRRRGEARLFYAALPESLMLKSGVLDFDVLVGQLKTPASRCGDRRLGRRPAFWDCNRGLPQPQFRGLLPVRR
jgi:hypothetical protein